MKIRLALIRILVVSVLGMSGFIHAGRQSSFAVIPDTQYSGDAAETIAIPLMQDWIWARAKDCNDGIPRDDSTARGCINWMGVVSVGDINNNHTDDYTKWINFYTQFGTLGPDGLGPIPFMTIDGNHDEGHAPDYPACVDEPEPCECGSPVLSKGKYCDETLYKAAFPISQYNFTGSGLVACSPPIPGSYNLEGAEDLNCLFRWPSGHGFDILVFGFSWFGYQAVLPELFPPDGWAQGMLAAQQDALPVFGFSHAHLKIEIDTEYDPDACIYQFWEYWPYMLETTPNWIGFINGHAIGVDEMGVVHEERAACAIVTSNAPHPGYPSGTPVVQFLLNWQDYNLPSTPNGLESLVVEVFTIDWDLNTMNVQVYEPTKDAFALAGEAPYMNHTWTNLDLDRFLALVDSENPVVSITNPLDGSDFHDLPKPLDIQADATDNTGIDRVEFYLDEELIGVDTVPTPNSSTFSYFWNWKKISPGSYNLAVTAHDLSGNTSTDSITLVKTGGGGNNGGENCNSNGTCDPGEDCNSCSSDCEGVTNGPPPGRYCCGNGQTEGPEGDGSICDGNF